MEKFSKSFVNEIIRSSLSRLFLATGVQQKDVAEFIGLDSSNLSRICNGRTIPRSDTYLNIVQACLFLSGRSGFGIDVYLGGIVNSYLKV